jgi:hypothetical protein
MFSLRYANQNPDFFSNFVDCDWEELSTQERRTAAELSFLTAEAFYQFRLKSGLALEWEEKWEYVDYWAYDESPTITYETKSIVIDGKQDRPVLLILQLGQSADGTPCLFAGIGNKELRKSGCTALKKKYYSLVVSPGRLTFNNDRVRMIDDEDEITERLEQDGILAGICADLSGNWQGDSPDEYVDLCLQMLELLFGEAQRIGLVL